MVGQDNFKEGDMVSRVYPATCRHCKLDAENMQNEHEIAVHVCALYGAWLYKLLVRAQLMLHNHPALCPRMNNLAFIS